MNTEILLYWVFLQPSWPFLTSLWKGPRQNRKWTSYPMYSLKWPFKMPWVESLLHSLCFLKCLCVKEAKPYSFGLCHLLYSRVIILFKHLKGNPKRQTWEGGPFLLSWLSTFGSSPDSAIIELPWCWFLSIDKGMQGLASIELIHQD